MRARVLRLVGLSLLCGGIVGALFSVGGGGFSWRALGVNFAVATTYTALIGTITTLTFAWLRPRTRDLSAWAQFAVFVAVLLGGTIAGSLASSGLFVAAGLFDAGVLWPQFWAGLRVALLISFVAGIGAWFYAGLRERLDASERGAMEARLSSLESRIRPHFLFNALNTVAALIPEDAARAEHTLERVTSLLRYSLDATARVVPLRDELRIVRDYLEIERARFGDRLRFTLEATPEAEAATLPAFTVQILVENAVKHGIAPRREGGSVAIAAERRDGALVVRVSDDGPGFSGAALPAGHGLDLLRERLRTTYGGGARLDFGGAAVTVVVPA